MLENASVLVADDEEMLREVLDKLLTREGYRVSLAASGEEALQLAKSSSFDIAIVDVMMPGIDGIQTLEELKRLDDQMPVIICTAYGSKEILIRAINSGAKYFIEKPFKNNVILQRLEEALLPRQLIAENEILRENLKAQNHGFNEIVGNSPSMRQVFSLISQVAPSRSTILVEGESGTGKELVARAIHSNSPRNDRPFVTVNSGSLPPDLLESNLFGHVKGAFTGAIGPKKGLFEVAHKGTIFFDEIGSVPLDTQSKLLRVIQEREFMRLGGVETIKVDVRIVAATNVDLGQMVEQGKFREDLYYRLHVITLPLPPLRSRREDIPLLAQHFLELYGRENEKTDLKLMPATVRLLEESHWPGNVRELENVIERAVVLAADNKIGPELVPDSIHKTHTFRLPNLDLPPQGIQLRKVIDEIESLLIVRALEVSGGVQKKAAELLHVKPTTLNEMIKRYGLAQRRNRESGKIEKFGRKEVAVVAPGSHQE